MKDYTSSLAGTGQVNGTKCPTCPLNDLNKIKKGKRHCTLVHPKGVVGTPNGPITERQLEILKLMDGGTTSNKDIASELQISESTINNLMVAFFDRIEISAGTRPYNRTHAFTIAKQMNWI